MIDTHCHIIPEVDDGPKTIEESMDLLREAISQGLTKVIATSHRRSDMFELDEMVIFRQYQQLLNAAEAEFPFLKIYYGGELYYSEEIFKRLESGQLPTLASSDYVLVEFEYFKPYNEILRLVDRVRSLGKNVILAHMERYEALASNIEGIQKLIDKGAYMQVNAQSLLPSKLWKDSHKVFKKRAKVLMKENLVHLVASDMHNLSKRRPYLKEAYENVKKVYGERRAKRLFVTNPQRIIDNETI